MDRGNFESAAYIGGYVEYHRFLFPTAKVHRGLVAVAGAFYFGDIHPERRVLRAKKVVQAGFPTQDAAA